MRLDERPLAEAVLEAPQIVAEARRGHVEDDDGDVPVDQRAGWDVPEAAEAVEEHVERLGLGHRVELVVGGRRRAMLGPPDRVPEADGLARLGEGRHLDDHPRHIARARVEREGEEPFGLGAGRDDELERGDVAAVRVDDRVDLGAGRPFRGRRLNWRLGRRV